MIVESPRLRIAWLAMIAALLFVPGVLPAMVVRDGLVLWLDADERVDPADHDTIRAIVAREDLEGASVILSSEHGEEDPVGRSQGRYCRLFRAETGARAATTVVCRTGTGLYRHVRSRRGSDAGTDRFGPDIARRLRRRHRSCRHDRQYRIRRARARRGLIDKSQVAGTVTLRSAGPILIVDFDLSARGPVEILAGYSDKSIWFNGFAQLESSGTSISAETGRVTLGMQGKRRYAVYLHNEGGRATTVNLQFRSDGEVVHEASLDYEPGR